MAKCVHTRVRGWIGLSARDPRAQGWAHIPCVWVCRALGPCGRVWMRRGRAQVGAGRDRRSLSTHQAPRGAASALVQRTCCQMGKPRAAACLSPPRPGGGLLPVNPGEPALPRPSHNMGLRQVSPRPPAKERDKDGPWERCRDRSRQRSGIESWNRVLLWPCSSEQGQGTAVEFCGWMWASRSPREPWPLLWGGDSCRGGSPHWRVSSPLRASVSSPVEQRVPPPPRSPLEGWRPKVISGTRQWSRHALLLDWEWGDEPGPGEEGAE